MSPAGWIRWYYRTRDSIGAPGLDFVDSTGRVYDKKCGSCGYKKRHATNAGTWVCGSCGKGWPHEDRYIFKGQVQKPVAHDAFENQNARWVDVGTVLHHLLNDRDFEWDAKLYVATCFGFSIDPLRDKDGNVKFPGLAVQFTELWPHAPGPWSRMSLYRRVTRAKDEWTRRLARSRVPTS